MPGFRDGDAGARKLRYLCTGEGTPTVLIEGSGYTSKAGHNIQREEPQLIVDAVLDVVKQVRDRR